MRDAAPGRECSELWSFGARQCLTTRPDNGPPFTVQLFTAQALSQQNAYATYDEAIAFGVESLRALIPQEPCPEPKGASTERGRVADEAQAGRPSKNLTAR